MGQRGQTGEHQRHLYSRSQSYKWQSVPLTVVVVPFHNASCLPPTTVESSTDQVWWWRHYWTHSTRRPSGQPGWGSPWSTWGWTDTSRGPIRWTRLRDSFTSASLETGEVYWLLVRVRWQECFQVCFVSDEQEPQQTLLHGLPHMSQC